MTQGDDAGLPVRAGLHPTGLYLALRRIGAEDLEDAFMQETIARIPAQERIVHVSPGGRRPSLAMRPRRDHFPTPRVDRR
jgi:hypothetical protein